MSSRLSTNAGLLILASLMVGSILVGLRLPASKTVVAQTSGENWYDRVPQEAMLSITASFVPTAADSSRALAVSVGGYHVCALTTVGTVKCWGDNFHGQLGDGTLRPRSTPVDVIGLPAGIQAVAVAPVNPSTCILTSIGGVKCWGRNNRGQLGNGTSVLSSTLPVNVVGLDHNIVALAAGYDSYYALTNSGGVKWWGGSDISTDVYNVPVDMVGLTSGVTAIAAGGDHACALTTTGAVKCWGWNAYGQLGDGTTTNRNTPVGVVGLVGGVRAITAGGGHTCAILNTGQVKCWGANFRGQLGDGTTTQRSTPVTVNGLVGDVAAITARGHAESGHTCVLSTAGKIMCWGDNAYGELGIGSFSSSSVPAAVTGLFQRAAQVSAGSYNTCAVSADSGIWCWGTNEAGVLGNGRPGAQIDPTQVVGLNEAVAAITAGAMHTCALTVGGQVKCWGNNNYGEVGDGASGHRHTPVNTVGLNNIQAIEAGYAHSCALTVLGNVKCWGSNFNGQLGNGQQGGYATIPVNVVGLSTGVAAFAVKAGGGHSCALLADGGIRCWGLNRYGQLGDGTLVYVRLTPVAVVNLSGPATSITAGGVHSCALLVNGSVQCWGDNTYGQLGNGSAVLSSTVPVTVSGMISGVIAITSGDFHSCALLAGGEACCWGSNEQGQLGEPAIEISSTVPVGVLGLNSGVTAILAGGDGTCAQVGNAMKCWGRVTHTSNGYFDNVPEPMDVLGLPVPSLVAKMAVGGLHRCALMTSGMVWCWGSNFYGQLGNGTFPFSTIPASVVGFEVVPAGVVYLPIILK